MKNDVLTEQQLLAQKARRQSTLEKLQEGNAPPEAIAEARKKLRLTELRLKKIENQAG